VLAVTPLLADRVPCVNPLRGAAGRSRSAGFNGFMRICRIQRSGWLILGPHTSEERENERESIGISAEGHRSIRSFVSTSASSSTSFPLVLRHRSSSRLTASSEASSKRRRCERHGEEGEADSLLASLADSAPEILFPSFVRYFRLSGSDALCKRLPSGSHWDAQDAGSTSWKWRASCK